MPRLKYLPEDFVVGEVSSVKIFSAGVFSLFRLWKRDCSTFEALRILSEKWDTPLRVFGVAGLKDRRAVTTQVCSVKGIIRSGDFGKVKVEHIGFSDVPVSVGFLDGNKFEIVVRDVGEVPLLNERFVNFFGSQRFGVKNADVGLCIVRGDWKGACELLKGEPSVGGWLVSHPTDCVGALRTLPLSILQLFVHAYQSRVWNSCVSIILSSGGIVPEMFPLPGFGTVVKNGSVLEEVLRRDGVGARDFVIRQIPEISSEGSEREVFTNAEELSVVVHDDDLFSGKKKVVVKFFLRKGCYATEFLRQSFGELQS